MGSGVVTGRHLIIPAFALLPLVVEPHLGEPHLGEPHLGEDRPAMTRAEDGWLEQELRLEGGEPRTAVSGRFQVHAAGDPGRLARILSSFETAYRAFWQSHLDGPRRDTGAAADRLVSVIVFARPESLRRAASRLGIAQPAFEAGGVFLRESMTIAVVNESALGRVVEAALVHEAAHLLNVEILGPGISPWFNEGLAGYCQYSQLTPDGRLLLGELDEGSELRLPQQDGSEVLYQFVPKKSLSYLMGQFFRNRRLSLGPMLDADSAERFYGENAQLHYAASWTLVHMLAQGRTRRDGALRPKLDRYADLEREARGGRAALLGVMEMSMEELDGAWHRHVKRLW